MGNICKPQDSKKDEEDKQTSSHHKKKGPTMVSYDFDSAKGQMRSLHDLAEPPDFIEKEEGKRVIKVKGLKSRK